MTSYQLLENETAILDTSGRWNKTLATGVLIYKCVASNSVGRTQSVNVAVTVNGEKNGKIFVLNEVDMTQRI